MANSTAFRIAQFVGFGGAAWLSGNIAALSLISVPALSNTSAEDSISTTTLSRQWKRMFEAGKTQNPPIAALTTSTFGYLAWSLRAGTPLSHLMPRNSARLYSVAALLTIGIVPYTIIFMSSTNNKLLEKAEGAGNLKGKAASTSDGEEVVTLLKKWTFLNGIRSSLPLLGCIAAVAASFV